MSPKFERANSRREIRKLLIVCEGEKTEPNYFKAFKKYTEDVIIKTIGAGMNTLSLVNYAGDKRNKARKAGSPYSEVWVVFDKDDFSADDFNRAILLAFNEKIRVAYSNESFELWYCLHFDYITSRLHRKQYCDKMAINLGIKKYEKKSNEIYEKLLDKQNVAIDNARKLFYSYDPRTPHAQKNPSTTVFRLVKELNNYIPHLKIEGTDKCRG